MPPVSRLTLAAARSRSASRRRCATSASLSTGRHRLRTSPAITLSKRSAHTASWRRYRYDRESRRCRASGAAQGGDFSLGALRRAYGRLVQPDPAGDGPVRRRRPGRYGSTSRSTGCALRAETSPTASALSAWPRIGATLRSAAPWRTSAVSATVGRHLLRDDFDTYEKTLEHPGEAREHCGEGLTSAPSCACEKRVWIDFLFGHCPRCRARTRGCFPGTMTGPFP